jgi:tRNA pseudouridine55 synthase
MNEDQIILINKPYDWTSFDVVKYVRNALGKIKVGHAGTLDPLATGLLVLCTGKMTKKITEIQDAEKEYTGSMILGATTASYDMETEVVLTDDFKAISEEVIRQTTQNFIGEIQQTPPAHSAVKINGRRAYDLARKGKEVNISAKTVTVREFEILNVGTDPESNHPLITFRIVCSKGTYIRSLVNDFGKALGCGAYLKSLCRTRIGNYRLEDAKEPKDIKLSVQLESPIA